MFPDSGGQYVYLREAYGDLVAFLYGWMLFFVANGGTIAALSVASSAYLGNIFPALSQQHVVLSIGRHGSDPRPCLCADFNCGSSPGSTSSACVRARFCKTPPHGRSSQPWRYSWCWGWRSARETGTTFTATATGGLSLGLSSGQLLSAFGVALIAVFWAYDGWVYITWVSGEVKDPRRNVPRAMVLGVLAVPEYTWR